MQYLECLQAELGRPDASGRRRPIRIPDSNFRLEVGAVITAIGQQPDLCPFPEPPVKTSPWCTIITDRGNTRTNVPDIFAGRRFGHRPRHRGGGHCRGQTGRPGY